MQSMCNHLLKDARSCPKGHHIDSKVRSLLDSKGKNSRNNAPSTGKLPPTPVPMNAKRRAVIGHDEAKATAVPKTPQMSKVVLNAGRRPMISDATPQQVDPRLRPMKVIIVVYRTVDVLMPNSVDSCGSTSASAYAISTVRKFTRSKKTRFTCIQRLDIDQHA